MPLESKKKKVIQILLLSSVSILFLIMAYSLSSIFNPVLLSLLLAYILDPLASILERWGVSRTITIFNIYFILTSLIVLLFLFFLPLIGSELSYLYDKTFTGDQFLDKNQNGRWDEGERITADIDSNQKYEPSYVQSITTWITGLIAKWNEKNPQQKIEWQYLLDFVAEKKPIEVGKTLFSVSKDTIFATIQTLLTVFSFLSYVILLPLYTFFLLRGLKGIRNTLYDYLPIQHKSEIIRILQRIHRSLSAFFRGKLIICLFKGLLTWGILELLGLRYALLFGIIQAIASVVPFLVLGVGMLPNLIILVLDIGMQWPYLVAVLMMYSMIEGVEGFLLTPWVMGQETGLHPLTIILGLLIGGNLFGLFGLILAIPVCSTLKILGQELLLPAWKELSGCTAGDLAPPACAGLPSPALAEVYFPPDSPVCAPACMPSQEGITPALMVVPAAAAPSEAASSVADSSEADSSVGAPPKKKKAPSSEKAEASYGPLSKRKKRRK